MTCPFTLRQREVLALVIDGLSNEEIAKRLVVESSTVKTTLIHMFAKVKERGVHNRTSLAVLALREGWAT